MQPIPDKEKERLKALKSYSILDSVAEEEFDRITELASLICGTPIALVSLIDEHRQWFKSKKGLEVRETSRDISFCQHAILDYDTFEVENAAEDPRFALNPLVTDNPKIKFYAGYPLTDPSGFNLGTLCVIDRKPRKLSEDQLRALQLLGEEVVSQIVARKKNIEREKLSRLFQLSIDMIGIIDNDGKFTSINPAFQRVMGRSSEEIIGHSFYQWVHKEDLDYTEKQVRKLDGVEPKVEFDNRIQIASGEYLNLHWTLTFDELNEEFYCIARDITTQVNTLNQLKIANEEAQRAVQVKDEFLANMSHEIRTPLNAIIGFNDLLMSSELNSEQREYVEIVSTASQNLMVIINDVLDTSKLENGKIQLENRMLSLKDVANYLNKLQKQKAKSKNIELITEVDDDIPPYVLGDRPRVIQILVNLMGNAIKFTDRGKVKLQVDLVSKRMDEVDIKFTVSDTGIGIDPEKLDVIFDRFVQAETSTSRNFGGTGLGLNIVKMLVNLHGGKLSVESNKGEGTTFSFVISMKIPESEDHPNSNGIQPPEDYQLEGKRILQVEDNKMNQLLATTYLERSLAVVDQAENGKEAVAMLVSNDYDLVMMDLQMPVMDGFEATKKIRNELKSDVPIVACSAHSLIGEKEKCLDHGMDDYISKPYNKSELLSVISEWSKKRHLP
jgi:PAS domain S-box-containing protein